MAEASKGGNPVDEGGNAVTDYFDEYERPVCPICKDEMFGRPCETSYCAGYEAGRLAAVRADVAYAAGHFERRADVWREHGQKAKGDLSRGCMAKAMAFAEKAKDCRRWLETTQ